MTNQKATIELRVNDIFAGVNRLPAIGKVYCAVVVFGIGVAMALTNPRLAALLYIALLFFVAGWVCGDDTAEL